MNGSTRKKYIYPLSTRRKMRAAHLGRKLTPEHKRNISKAMKARVRNG